MTLELYINEFTESTQQILHDRSEDPLLLHLVIQSFNRIFSMCIEEYFKNDEKDLHKYEAIIKKQKTQLFKCLNMITWNRIQHLRNGDHNDI